MNVTIHNNHQKFVLKGTPGANLAQFLTDNGFFSGIICGRGICGKCAVRIISGKVNNINTDSLLDDDCVLACMSTLTDDDLELELLQSNQKFIFRKTGNLNFNRQIKLNDRNIKKIFIPDGQTDLIPDYPKKSVLSQYLINQNKTGCTLVISANDNLIDVESGDTTKTNYGFVIDLGTTTIACYLIDLANGKTVSAHGLLNPQTLYGADVITRIEHGLNPEKLKKMHEQTLHAIIDTLNRLLKENEVSSQNVYSMVVVGNTTMSRIFLNQDVKDLATAPFILTTKSRVHIKAAGFHLPCHPEADIEVLANISAYVGSDALAMLIACKPERNDQWDLMVDVGTNGEIILAGKNNIYACSAAAGPAFEGASIKYGMRAEAGAIDKVQFNNNEIIYNTIDDAPPKGICGSGLISCVSEMLRTGIIDKTGRFCNHSHPVHYLQNRIRIGENKIKEFVITEEKENQPEIVITQNDIRELQLAKAAIAAGIQILCDDAGIQLSDIKRVFLAGAFGSYLDLDDLSRIGLFSTIRVDHIVTVGNAAALGAAICLESKSKLRESDVLANQIQSVNLADKKNFNTIWIGQMDF